MAIRIVLAEDHVMTRQGLRTMLERQGDMEVVGEASNGRDAIALVRDNRPDVVVMDITMPVLNGMEATHHIHKECPGTKVVILSMHASHEHIAGVLRAGATGYVLKDSPFEELVHAIRVAVSGGTFLSPKVTSMVMADFAAGSGAEPRASREHLTPQEREVLQMVSEGKTTKEIAIEVGKTPKAVEATRRRIAAKLGVSGTAEMVRAAIKKGLASIDF